MLINKKYFALIIIMIIAIGGLVAIYRYHNIKNIVKEIESGNTKDAIKLIKKTKDVNLYTNPSFLNEIFLILDMEPSSNPLIIACENGNYEVVEALLKKGANPNTYRKGNWTPIEILYVRGVENRYDIAKLLIEYGADVNNVKQIISNILRN